MKKNIKSGVFISLILIVIGTTLLSGCNTVNGFGRDVSGTGRSIQRAS